MSSAGATATNIQLYGGADGNPASVTTGGNLGTQIDYDFPANFGRYVLRTGKVTTLSDVPGVQLLVFSPSTNGNVWYAGTDTAAPQVGVGNVILPGTLETISITDSNQIGFTPTNDGDTIYILGLMNNSAATVVPNNPPAFTKTPPTLTPYQPPTNNATNISVYASIIVASSAPLDPNTVNNTTVTATPTMQAVIAIDSQNPDNIIVTPTSPLNVSTTYTITYGTGIADLNGNTLASAVPISFTTASTMGAPDTTPPTVVSANPGSYTTNFNPANVPAIVFSEAINLGSVNNNNVTAFITNNNQQIPNLLFSLSLDLQTLYISNMNLQVSTNYQINILGGTGIGLTDLAGNNLAASYVIPFGTSPYQYSLVYNVAGNSYQKVQGQNITQTGIVMLGTRSKLIGLKPVNYTFILQKYGNPTGTVYFTWFRTYDGGYTYQTFRSLGSINVVGLSSVNDVIVNCNDSTNTNPIEYNDYIAVVFSGGDSNNYLNVKVSNYDAFDSSNTCNGMITYSGNQNTNETVDLAGTISVNPS